MPHIYKQALAEQDLIDIWLYTFEMWGEIQADKYLDDLEQAIKLLSETPLMCREREEFTPLVRIHQHEHHLIVYDTAPNGINIIRVLHESMDVEARLDE